MYLMKQSKNHCLYNEFIALKIILVDVCQILWCRGIFRKQFPQKFPAIDWSHGDPGDPLFLTPYIEKGDIDHGTDDSSTELM